MEGKQLLEYVDCPFQKLTVKRKERNRAVVGREWKVGRGYRRAYITAEQTRTSCGTREKRGNDGGVRFWSRHEGTARKSRFGDKSTK